MPMADEYQYIEIEGTRQDFIKKLNKEGEQCWIPVWQTMIRPRISITTGYFAIYLYRKYSTTNRSRQEQKIICNEEGINNYPTLGAEI